MEKGKVSGLMCSYNEVNPNPNPSSNPSPTPNPNTNPNTNPNPNPDEVNGIPSCANSWLLNNVAREAWGFDGYITSDCDADANVYNSHHYTATPEEAVRDSPSP